MSPRLTIFVTPKPSYTPSTLFKRRSALFKKSNSLFKSYHTLFKPLRINSCSLRRKKPPEGGFKAKYP